MRIIKRHRTKQGLVGLLLAALVGGALIAGSGPQVKAATIGDTLDNSTLSTKTNSSGIPQVVTPTGNPWSMYQIPGLGRERKPSEGSFVKWGYNGWSGASAGMPLSADISAGGSSAVSATTSAWNNGQAGSPVAISFKDTGSARGNPYFSLNYVNKNSLVDFGSSTDTANNMDPLSISRAWAGQQTLTAAQQAQVFNQGSGTDSAPAKSKMILKNGKYVLDTASNNSFDGGYMQATGNVPIKAAVAGSKSTVDATMAGNWAVMVRVQVAKGIDAKAFAASIAWDKSYYYLQVDSISLLWTHVSLNFPMQFDHHVYFDPANPQTFYLKVKGIPFWHRQKNSTNPISSNGYSQMQLQDGNADYIDYLHNRQISSGSATTLDNLGTSQKPGASLNDDTLTTKTSSGTQPDFSTYNQSGGSLSGNPLWNPYSLLPLGLGAGKSPVMESGQTGQMIASINSASSNATTSRKISGGIFDYRPPAIKS